MSSSPLPPDPDDPRSLGRQGRGTARFARRILKAWACVLMLVFVAALVKRWLEPPAVPIVPAIPASTATAPVQQDTVASMADEEAALIEREKELVAMYAPRTVEEMLREYQDDAGDVVVAAPLPAPGPDTDAGDSDIDQLSEADEIDISEELAGMIREARYAQIEGDIRRSIIKLEQASELAPGHPVLAYYYGLAYEYLRNAPKSREYFAKVVAERDRAGKFYELAAIHLEKGFESPSDRRGDIALGTILEYREPNVGDGERVVLTIPVMMKEGLNIRADDLYIPIQFFDAENGKSIAPANAHLYKVDIRWITEPVDWESGEEVLEVRYYMPPFSEEELTAYGERRYYGYTAKLYYKGEPMDCRGAPPVLFLIEQKQNKSSYYDEFGNDFLLPVLDSVPAADQPGLMPGYSLPEPGSSMLPGDDAGLLPP